MMMDAQLMNGDIIDLRDCPKARFVPVLLESRSVKMTRATAVKVNKAGEYVPTKRYLCYGVRTAQ